METASTSGPLSGYVVFHALNPSICYFDLAESSPFVLESRFTIMLFNAIYL